MHGEAMKLNKKDHAKMMASMLARLSPEFDRADFDYPKELTEPQSAQLAAIRDFIEAECALNTALHECYEARKAMAFRLRLEITDVRFKALGAFKPEDVMPFVERWALFNFKKPVK